MAFGAAAIAGSALLAVAGTAAGATGSLAEQSPSDGASPAAASAPSAATCASASGAPASFPIMPWASAMPFASNAPVQGVPGTAVLGDILYSSKPYNQGPDIVRALDPTGVRPVRTILIGGWNPDLRPDGSEIVFTTFPNPDPFDIFTMCPDGSNVQRLTDDDFPAYRPRWSPDGTKVTYNGFPGEIWVVNADGSGGVRVATDSVFGAWSPDGKHFAYGKSAADSATNADDIFVADGDGSNAHDITNRPGNDEFPSWSPDGTKIAFSSDATGRSDIYVMNADGSNVTQLTNDPVFEDAEQWSPDGTQIVYERKESDNAGADIWVMNADGTDQRDLTNTPNEDDAMPSWR